MAVAYEKESGKRTYFQFEIDRRDAIATGNFVAEAPEDAKSEDEIEMDAENLQKVAGIAERARLGGPVLPEERDQLNQFQASADLDAPGAPPGVPAPEPVLVADVFNPATAGRAELFGYLRERDVEVGNASSTESLREKVFETMSSKQSDAE